MISVTSTEHDFIGLGLNPAALDSQDYSHSIRSQVIVVETSGHQVAFPSNWVEEVMLFPRQRVLKIPFYQYPILGIVPHQGNLVLLLASQADVQSDQKNLGQQENIRAIRLGDQMETLSGAAIVIDKIVGTVDASSLESRPSLQLFSPDYISPEAFNPYRWI
jgi:hypothetical protein